MTVFNSLTERLRDIAKLSGEIGKTASFKKKGIRPRFSFNYSTENLMKAIKVDPSMLAESVTQSFRKHISANITKNQLNGGTPSASSLTSASAPMNDKYKGQLLQLYEKAWMRQYAEYVQRHKSVSPDAIYNERPWGKQKKAMKGKEAPWYRPTRKIMYSSQGLATGFLRRSIQDSFKKGGGKFLTIHQSLTQVGWQWHPERYDPTYAKWMTNVSGWMAEQGITPEEEPMVDFQEKDWRAVAEVMNVIYRNGPIEDIQDIIEKLKWGDG